MIKGFYLFKLLICTDLREHAKISFINFAFWLMNMKLRLYSIFVFRLWNFHFFLCLLLTLTACRVSVFGVILDHFFPHSGLTFRIPTLFTQYMGVTCNYILDKMSGTKKWSFPLRNSSVNVTKSAASCGSDHIYWINF